MEELGGSPLARLPEFSRIDEEVDLGVLSGLTARGGFCDAAPLTPGRQRLSRHENHRGAIGALRPVYGVGLGEPRGHDQLEDHGPVGTGSRRLGLESRSCDSVSNSAARLASSPASLVSQTLLAREGELGRHDLGVVQDLVDGLRPKAERPGRTG